MPRRKAGKRSADTVPAVGTPAPASATWAASVAAFLDTRESPRTRRNYAAALQRAHLALEVGHLGEITGPGLAAFRRAVLESEAAPATKALTLSAVRSFLTWAGRLGLHTITRDQLDAVLAAAKGTRQRAFTVLGDEELSAMFTAADTARDRALLGLLVGAGLRLAEVAGLRVEDLHDNGKGLLVHVRGPHAKGSRPRNVPVARDVRGLVLAYLEATGRALGDTGPLFERHDRAQHTLELRRMFEAFQRDATDPEKLRQRFERLARAGRLPKVPLLKIEGVNEDEPTQYVDLTPEDAKRVAFMYRSAQISAPSAPLSVRAIGLLVTRLAERANIKGKRVTPHALRHTYAVRLLRNGGSTEELRRLLGHSSLTTTQVYADHLEDEDLRAHVPALPTFTPLKTEVA